MYDQISKRAGSNITVISKLRFAELKHAYATCRALVFAAEEDFGIVPVEANASGRPVLAYGRGGVRDSIIPGETGVFFDQQSVESLIEGVNSLETWLPHFSPHAAVRNAQRFAPERFDDGMRAVLTEAGLC
jgi:glycosyltransferase involved in cell wall biosynthesis